jgi:hypothetical protein
LCCICVCCVFVTHPRLYIHNTTCLKFVNCMSIVITWCNLFLELKRTRLETSCTNCSFICKSSLNKVLLLLSSLESPCSPMLQSEKSASNIFCTARGFISSLLMVFTTKAWFAFPASEIYLPTILLQVARSVFSSWLLGSLTGLLFPFPKVF